MGAADNRQPGLSRRLIFTERQTTLPQIAVINYT